MVNSLWADIYDLTNHNQTFFKGLLKEAKQHVQEPPQPKIKLKVPQNLQTVAQPKKITIHVAGGKDSAAGSPAPAVQSTDAETTRNGTPSRRVPFNGPAAVTHSQLEKTRSMSASAPSPSPSVTGAIKPEESTRQSPSIPPPGPAMITQQQFAPVMHPISNGIVAPPAPPKRTTAEILEAQKYRPHPISKFEASQAGRSYD